MAEKQNIEYKQSWHDDHLKWLVGFANAAGGVLYIGKDDAGEPVGISESKKLMDELPGKIRSKLGIIVDINLYETDGKEIIEISVQPYSNPVSLRGVYYYRSGTNNLELTGTALNDFLMKKTGQSWDSLPEEKASSADLSSETIDKFVRDAVASGRMPDGEELTTVQLLEKLRLIDQDLLKRAAIVLFGSDPAKFFPTMSVRIGRFATDEDLKFQELLEGNLIRLLFDTLEMLDKKFFIKDIRFEGVQRIETPPYPLAALREIILNALVHRLYTGAHVQIRVYDNKLTVWNQGLLPPSISLESLKGHHASIPRNPLVANGCFYAGYIDSWGRGTLKIINACKEHGLPEPEIIEQDGGIRVTLFKAPTPVRSERPDLFQRGNFNERQINALQYLLENKFITNSLYQLINKVGKTVASQELQYMVAQHALVQIGSVGRGIKYRLPDK